MKAIVWALVLLCALAGVLGAARLARPPLTSRDCADGIVIVGGRGGPLECVCVGGRISTCFDPGP